VSQFEDKAWEDWTNKFDDALFECSEKGTPRRMTISFGDEPVVVVDIYRQGSTMKKFDEMILGAVKQQAGIDVAKRENK
jgi:hypothetical protein